MGMRFQQYQIATNSDVYGIVKAAVISAAINVRNEAPETPNHANRVVLANTVYAEMGSAPSDVVRTFVWLVSMNPTILQSAFSQGVIDPEAIQDNDVDYVIASLWDQIAGSE